MSDARHPTPASPVPMRPTAGEMLEEILPLLGAVPGAGPPVVLLAGPWLLLALMLAGPFALLVTLLIVMLAAVVLIAALGAIAATPYLLVRHLRAALARRATSRARAQPLPANPPAMADRAPSPESVSVTGY